MGSKLELGLLARALAAYIPSLATTHASVAVRGAKGALRVFVPDGDAFDVFVLNGSWHWMDTTTYGALPVSWRIPNVSGWQTISAAVAGHLVALIAERFGRDRSGRLMPSTSINYPVAARIHAECLRFLIALRDGQVALTDGADQYAGLVLASLGDEASASSRDGTERVMDNGGGLGGGSGSDQDDDEDVWALLSDEAEASEAEFMRTPLGSLVQSLELRVDFGVVEWEWSIIGDDKGLRFRPYGSHMMYLTLPSNGSGWLVLRRYETHHFAIDQLAIDAYSEQWIVCAERGSPAVAARQVVSMLVDIAEHRTGDVRGAALAALECWGESCGDDELVAYVEQFWMTLGEDG